MIGFHSDAPRPSSQAYHQALIADAISAADSFGGVQDCRETLDRKIAARPA